LYNTMALARSWPAAKANTPSSNYGFFLRARPAAKV